MEQETAAGISQRLHPGRRLQQHEGPYVKDEQIQNRRQGGL